MIGLRMRTAVRPVVTYAMGAAFIAASLIYEPVALFAVAPVFITHWFVDRSKEREAQHIVYEQQNLASQSRAVEMNIWAENNVRRQEQPPQPVGPTKADAIPARGPMGYQTPQGRGY